MATIYYFDGIESYGTSGDQRTAMLQAWGNVSSGAGACTIRTGRYSGKAFSVGLNGGSFPGNILLDLNHVHSSSPFTTVTLGVAVQGQSDGMTEQAFIRFLDTSQTVLLNVEGGSYGSGGSSGILHNIHFTYSSSDTNIDSYETGAANSTWHYLEIKYHPHTSTGTLTVKWDGVQVISYSGATSPNNNGVRYIEFSSGVYASESASNPSNSSYLADYVYFDDIYIADDFVTNATTSTIKRLAPSGEGTTHQWACSTGSTHYTLLDENPPNGDTDYVSTSSTSQVELVALADVGSTVNDPSTVHAICLRTTAKNTGTPANLTHIERFSGSNTTHSTFSPTSDYQTFPQVLQTSPASAAYSVSDVNGLETGVTS
jgi:hypothetical protein